MNQSFHAPYVLKPPFRATLQVMRLLENYRTGHFLLFRGGSTVARKGLKWPYLG